MGCNPTPPLAPLNAPTCPLCGQPNQCAAVAAATFAVSCWCREVVFTPDLLAQIPPDKRRQACICRPCVEDHLAKTTS